MGPLRKAGREEGIPAFLFSLAVSISSGIAAGLPKGTAMAVLQRTMALQVPEMTLAEVLEDCAPDYA
jgi:hypothetical protein